MNKTLLLAASILATAAIYLVFALAFGFNLFQWSNEGKILFIITTILADSLILKLEK